MTRSLLSWLLLALSGVLLALAGTLLRPADVAEFLAGFVLRPVATNIHPDK